MIVICMTCFNNKHVVHHVYEYSTLAFENRQFILVQLNNVVFKIVSFDKPYTQFAGHYTIQSLEMID